MPHHIKYIKCIEKHGQSLQSVYIELDQSVPENRQNACRVIRGLANLSIRRLKKLRVKFTGENPYFYAGKEFVEALGDLFKSPEPDTKVVKTLESVDLSGLTVAYDDSLFRLLYENHPNLQQLNIQNRQLVCKVSPTCILQLVQMCRKLTELAVFKCSLSEDVLKAFSEKDRTPLRLLSIKCRREEKYSKDISSEVWQSLATALPDLRVTLIFDHNCPLHLISEIMKPEIPVSVLRLETYTYIYDEVRHATNCYCDTLEKVVLQTPLSRNSPELNAALLEMAAKCTKLTALHVFCVLEKETVEKILQLRPCLEESKAYTLKYSSDPHPWSPND